MRTAILVLMLLSAAVVLPLAAPVASAGPCDNDIEELICITIEYAQKVIEIILRLIGPISTSSDPVLLA